MNEEENKSDEELAAVIEALKEQRDAFNKTSDAANAYGATTTKVFPDVSDAARRSGEAISEANANMRKGLAAGGNAIVKTTTEAMAGNKDLGRITNELTKHLTSTAFAFSNFSKKVTEDNRSSTMESISQIQNIIKESGKNIPGGNLLSKLGGETGVSALVGQLSDITASAEGVEDYRSTLMSLAATRGDLGKFFTETGENFEGLGDHLRSDVATNLKLAESLKISVGEVEKLNVAFNAIPGTLGATVKVGSEATKQLSLLDAAVNLARGSGRKFTEIQDDINVALNEFGFSAQKAIEYSARISEVSKAGGIPLAQVKNIIHDVSGTYRLYGDNVDAASRMTLKFYDNLRQSGVSAKDSENIIKGFSKSVENLSLAQKSFLSSQTGGPGGLLGGLQIEKMLSEGKMDEVFDKVKATIQKQFNGKIMTLADVKTQEDASIFTKQRTLLTQGPLGKIVGSDAEASKVLESFKRGEKATISGAVQPQITKDATDSLVGPIEKGNEIALRSSNILGEIQRGAEVAIREAGLNKGLEGISTMTGGTTLKDTMAASTMKQEVRAKQEMSSNEATSRVMQQKTGNPVPVSNLNDLVDKKSIINNAITAGKSVLTQAQENVKTTESPKRKEVVMQEANIISTKPSPKISQVDVNKTTKENLKATADNAAKVATVTTDNQTSDKSKQVIKDKSKTDISNLMEELRNRYGSEVNKQKQEASNTNEVMPTLAEKGANVALEAAKQSEIKSPATANKEQAAQSQTIEMKHSLEVDITGHCKVCGKQEHVSKNVLALNPAAGLGKNLK